MDRWVLVVLVLAAVAIEARHAPDLEGHQHNRDKRQISWNGVIGTAACSPKVIQAAQECNRELDEKLKGRESENSDEMQCCRFAEFRRCIEWEANKECGKDPAESVNAMVKAIQGGLSSKCESYTYYSPVCIYYIWYNYLILGGIVLFILSIGCCLGACCCR